MCTICNSEFAEKDSQCPVTTQNLRSHSPFKKKQKCMYDASNNLIYCTVHMYHYLNICNVIPVGFTVHVK